MCNYFRKIYYEWVRGLEKTNRVDLFVQGSNAFLFSSKCTGEQQILSVPSVYDAFMQLPNPTQPMKISAERTEELDVELTDVATTEEEIEQMQDKQREELEQKKLSWD